MVEQVEQKIGNYRLLQPLGKGAFADVYLGEHLYLNTQVAIKVRTSTITGGTSKVKLLFSDGSSQESAWVSQPTCSRRKPIVSGF